MVDLNFVEKIPFLISVTKPINLLQVNKLKSRTVGSIFQQISKQIAVFRSRGFHIKKVWCDPKSDLVGLGKRRLSHLWGEPFERSRSECVGPFTRYHSGYHCGSYSIYYSWWCCD